MNRVGIRRAFRDAVKAGKTGSEIKTFKNFKKKEVDYYRADAYPLFLLGQINNGKRPNGENGWEDLKDYSISFIIYEKELQVRTKQGTDDEFLIEEQDKLEAIGEAILQEIITGNEEIIAVMEGPEFVYEDDAHNDKLLGVQFVFKLRVFDCVTA